MKKKTLLLMMMLAVAITLAACTQNNPQSGAASPPAPAASQAQPQPAQQPLCAGASQLFAIALHSSARPQAAIEVCQDDLKRHKRVCLPAMRQANTRVTCFVIEPGLCFSRLRQISPADDELRLVSDDMGRILRLDLLPVFRRPHP